MKYFQYSLFQVKFSHFKTAMNTTNWHCNSKYPVPSCISEMIDRVNVFLFPLRQHWPLTPIDLFKIYKHWEKCKRKHSDKCKVKCVYVNCTQEIRPPVLWPTGVAKAHNQVWRTRRFSL